MGNNPHVEKKYGYLIDVLFIFLIVVISAVYFFFCKIYFGMNGDFGDGAVTLFYRNYLDFCEGQINFWNTYEWCGTPSIGHTVFQTCYPIYLALFMGLKSVSFELFMPIVMTFHVSLMAAGLYLFNRVNKLGKTASFAAAMVTLSSAEFMRHIFWVYLFTGFAWLPLTLTMMSLFEKTAERKKSLLYIILASIFLGMSGLANQGQTLLINILFVCLFYLCYCFVNRKKEYIVSMTIKMFIFGITSFSICACTLIPGLVFTQNCARYVPEMGFVDAGESITMEAFTSCSTTLSSVLGSLLQVPSVLTQYSGYWGFAALAVMVSFFGVIGFFAKKKDIQVSVNTFSVVTLVFCLLYVCNAVLPYIFFYIPGYNAIREPFLYIPYLIIPLSWFVGCGINKLFELSGSLKQQPSEYKNIAILMILILTICCGILLPYNMNKYNVIILIGCIVITGLAFIMRNQKIRRFVLTFLMIPLTLGQLVVNYIQYPPYTQDYRDIYSAIERQENNLKDVIAPIAHNVERYDRFFGFGVNAWSSNTLSIMGQNDAIGYINPITRSGLVLNSLEWKNQSILRNIKYWYTTTDKEDYYHAVLNEMGVYLGTCDAYPSYDSAEKASFDVYEVATPGLAWCVNHTVPVQDFSEISIQEAIDTFNNSGLDFSSTAMVAGDNINVESDTNQWTIDNINYQSDTIGLEVSTNEDTLLVVAEAWYPGWEVYVDGEKTEILQVNFANRGCIVPAGNHNIKFVYEPIGFKLGLIIFCVCVVVVIGCFVYFLFVNNKKPKEEKTNG